MDNGYEPMDIDLSSNSIHAMDISYNDNGSTTPEVRVKEELCDTNCVQSEDNISENRTQTQINTKVPTAIKRFSLNIKSQKQKMYRLSNTALYVIFTVLAVISIIVYQILNFECSKELNLKDLQQSLSKNVIGQPDAINTIMEALEDKAHNKLLLLYGGTGVGKTFTISLILENLYHYANIYHYTMPSFMDRFPTDLMIGMALCPSSLIVIDDLSKSDVHIKDPVLDLINKSNNLNNSITIILVFNCDIINDHYIKKCDYSFHKDLKQIFSKINASKWFIKYNSLTEEHLRSCIEKELGDRSLSDGEFKDILKNFNVTIDGCKAVYTKIKSLNVF